MVVRASHKLDSIPKFKSIALITYTNAAANEIAARIYQKKDMFIGTIHRFCLEFILRPFGWLYNWGCPKVISYEEQKRFFDENKDIQLENSFGQNKFDELGKIKKNLDGQLDLGVDWEHEIEFVDVATRYYEFQSELKVIDFNEILYRSYKIIAENNFVAESLANKFYEILVDEFQDTNIYQYEILRKINDSGDCTFFMVGDDRQQIFTFAGAIRNAFKKAKIDFEAQLEMLTQTYRSSDNIVKAYSNLYENHPIIENKSENKNFSIRVLIHQTKKDNHDEYLKTIIRNLIENARISPSEIAILSTSWFTAFLASKVLRKEYNMVGLGALPHKNINNSTFNLLKSLARYFYSRSIGALKSIKRDIELYLLENNLIFPDKIIYQKTNFIIAEFLKTDLDLTIEKGIMFYKNLFDRTFKVSHSTFDEIIKLIKDDEKSTWNIGQYIKTLSGVDGIMSNTIHKAKGLEFDAVILNQMNENKIPYQKLITKTGWIYEKLTTERIEVGRKLFYIALSRAKKYLIIFHNWKPSMFIEIIDT